MDHHIRNRPKLTALESPVFSYLSVPTLLFFLTPGVVVNNNLDDFYFVDAILSIYFSLFAILVTAFAFFIIEQLLVVEKLKNIFRHILRFLFIFLLITGLYLPLSSISVMAEIATAPLIWSNLAAAFILTLIIFSLSFSRFGVPVRIGILALFCLNILVAAYGFNGLYSKNSRPSDETRENFRNLSEQRNIIIMSFDGIPRDIAARLLETDPNLRKKFSDFRFFTNVISSSPLTVASISAEMYGNRDFKLQVETGDELRAFDVPNLITNKLESHGYSVSTYGNYSQEFQNPDRVLLRNEFIDSDLREKTSEVFFFYDFVLVLMGTRYALKAFNKVGIKNAVFYLVGYADSLLRIGRTSTADETILLKKINESKGKNWDRPMIKTIMDYRLYVSGLRVNESSDVAHFLHFSHTHYPVDFDRNCRFRSDDEIWHQLRQNEAGVTDEAYCALTQMAEFLTRLQQLDIYDRSLVVLKSDHGKPALYFDKSQLQSFQIRNQLDWGYNRYTPLLMIKDFDSRAESIDFDDNPAMLDDLARTLCLHSEIKTDCTIYPGFDLLDPDLHISEDTDAVIFIATNSRANSYWRTREALHLQRSKDFYRTLHDALVSELLTEAIACEKPIIFEHNMPFNNGFSDYRSWVAWSEGEARFLKLKLDRCAQVVFVTVQSASDPNGPVFSAAINGRDIGDRITIASPEALSMSTYKIGLKPGDGDDNGTILIALAPAERALPGDFRFVSIEYAPRN